MVNEAKIAEAHTKHFLEDGEEYSFLQVHVSTSALLMRKSDEARTVAMRMAAMADASHSQYADGIKLMAIRTLMVAAYQQPYDQAVEILKETQAAAQGRKCLKNFVDGRLEELTAMSSQSYATDANYSYQNSMLKSSIGLHKNVMKESYIEFGYPKAGWVPIISVWVAAKGIGERATQVNSERYEA